MCTLPNNNANIVVLNTSYQATLRHCEIIYVQTWRRKSWISTINVLFLLITQQHLNQLKLELSNISY